MGIWMSVMCSKSHARQCSSTCGVSLFGHQHLLNTFIHLCNKALLNMILFSIMHFNLACPCVRRSCKMDSMLILERKLIFFECGVNDAPLFSPKRIWRAIRLWIWFVAVCDKDDLSFWDFIRYDGRPHASEKAGKY